MVIKSPGGAEGEIKLLKWWLTEAGIPWGTPGDFDICVAKAEKVFAEHGVKVDPKGWCSNLHVKATGARPGHAPGEQVAKH